MNEEQIKVLVRGEWNVKTLRLTFQWGSILGIVAIGGFYLYRFIEAILSSNTFVNLMIDHPKASIGVPLACFFSTVLVIVFENYSGEVKLEIPGFKLNGAAGPLIFWCVCFFSIITGINMLW